DALADDVHRLKAHAFEFIHAGVADQRGELFNVMPDSANQLAAVATAGAPGDATRLQQHHREAALGQFDGGIEPGEAAADDADIGCLLTFKARQVELSVGTRSVIGRCVVWSMNGGLASTHGWLLK